MDRSTIGVPLTAFIKKFRYVFLVILTGIFLMALPERKTEQEPSEHREQPAEPVISLEKSLSDILSKIEGAGKVEVLLTHMEGEKILYQTDEKTLSSPDSGNVQRDTVLVTGSDRLETGLIRQIIPPKYHGAIIVCQGADRAGIRLSIVEAVMSVTGLSSDKITVLKMK